MLDGLRLISAGRDGRLAMWEVASGRLLARWDADVGAIESFDLAGRESLFVGGNRTRRFDIDLTTWRLQERNSYDNPRKAMGVAISPDARRCAATDSRAVIVWDNSRMLTLPGHRGGAFGLMFSPDGSLLASTGDDSEPTVRIWDLRTGALSDELTGHTGRVWCVSFSPDGKRLATASRDGTIKLWDPTIRPDRTVPPPGFDVVNYGVTPSGATLLAASRDGRAAAFDMAEHRWGEPRRLFQERVDRVVFSPADDKAVAILPNGSVLLHCSDRPDTSLTVPGNFNTTPSALAFSPEGRYFAAQNFAARPS